LAALVTLAALATLAISTKKLARPRPKRNATAHHKPLSVPSAQPSPSLVPPRAAPCSSRSQTLQAQGHSRATQPGLRPLSQPRCNSINYLEGSPSITALMLTLGCPAVRPRFQAGPGPGAQRHWFEPQGSAARPARPWESFLALSFAAKHCRPRKRY
jgi:hypothetical protein